MAQTRVDPPRWFWVVSVLALLWMCSGVMAFAMDLATDESTVATLSEAQRELYASRPSWLLGVYGVATVSGLLGAIGLLMRRGWAVPMLVVSLVAVTIQFGYTTFGLEAMRLLGAAAALTFPIVIFVLGAATLWLATIAQSRGWLR